MKYLLFIIFMVLVMAARANTVIYTPGVGGKVLSDTPNGIMITDLAGGGNTTVETFGSTTVIQSPFGPPTFIRSDSPYAPIEPVVPVQEGLDLPVEPYL